MEQAPESDISVPILFQDDWDHVLAKAVRAMSNVDQFADVFVYDAKDRDLGLFFNFNEQPELRTCPLEEDFPLRVVCPGADQRYKELLAAQGRLLEAKLHVKNVLNSVDLADDDTRRRMMYLDCWRDGTLDEMRRELGLGRLAMSGMRTALFGEEFDEEEFSSKYAKAREEYEKASGMVKEARKLRDEAKERENAAKALLLSRRKMSGDGSAARPGSNAPEAMGEEASGWLVVGEGEQAKTKAEQAMRTAAEKFSPDVGELSRAIEEAQRAGVDQAARQYYEDMLMAFLMEHQFRVTILTLSGEEITSPVMTPETSIMELHTYVAHELRWNAELTQLYYNGIHLMNLDQTLQQVGVMTANDTLIARLSEVAAYEDDLAEAVNRVSCANAAALELMTPLCSGESEREATLKRLMARYTITEQPALELRLERWTHALIEGAVARKILTVKDVVGIIQDLEDGKRSHAPTRRHISEMARDRSGETEPLREIDDRFMEIVKKHAERLEETVAKISEVQEQAIYRQKLVKEAASMKQILTENNQDWVLGVTKEGYGVAVPRGSTSATLGRYSPGAVGRGGYNR